MDSPATPHRGPRIAAALQLWLINLGIAGIVALGYLQRAPEDLSLRGIAFLVLGFLSSLGMLSILPGSIGLLWACTQTRITALGLRLGALWTLALSLLYADTRVFGVFQFHLNAVIWNSLTTPGAGDAIHPGIADVVLPTLAILGAITCQARLFGWLYAGCERRAAARRARGSVGAGALAMSVLLLLAFTAERNIYAHDVEQGKHELATLAELLPYYQLPQNVMRKLRDAPPTAGEIVFDLTERELDWPTEPLQWKNPKQRPNVLVLVLDSLRGDMLTQETMPHTWAFSHKSRVYQDHWSGGNCTRHGIFTLLYGLPGNYWEPILREQRSPLLLDVLIEQGYEPRVLCSASQSFPEFRSTAWSKIQDAVEDNFNGEVWEKDLQVAARLGDWLDERQDPSRPFFVFSLLDGSHANYSFPPEATHFKPSRERIEYIRLSYGLDEKDRQEIFNRYRNAVRQADTTVGKMLHQISKRGLLENTIVVITGDHGEEFFENGYWGHHSNFTPEQVQVPFLLHGPGIKAGVETKPSSHVDFSRTLLESLGVSPKQASNYSTGEHLLNLPNERLILSASWSSMALRLENQSTLVISDYADDLPLRAFDSNGKPLLHEIEALRRTAPKLEEVLATCQRFLTTDLMRQPDHP